MLSLVIFMAQYAKLSGSDTRSSGPCVSMLSSERGMWTNFVASLK